MNIQDFLEMVEGGRAKDSEIAEAFLTMKVTSGTDINNAIEIVLEYRPIVLNCVLLQIDSMMPLVA